jgi:hypothetical protein
MSPVVMPGFFIPFIIWVAARRVLFAAAAFHSPFAKTSNQRASHKTSATGLSAVSFAP